ncbi:MAG TPA: alpha-ketoglutarate-dependent dioxygenase AlkB [Acidimicrobiales bacterium]|jgi:alkylated DNA repair dioxygenase AlkB|nr:alpha-ketoglutarate-dependent dioxygenase AlkB [Acidimicrobiales bacterium]
MADAVGLAWQGSLLATGEASVDRSFADLRRHELAGGAWVEYVPGWLAGADEVFALLLATVPWAQHERHMYTGKVVEPRLRASWRLGADVEGVPPVVEEMGAVLRQRYDRPFDTVGCNLYRHGGDSVAWHGDRIPAEIVDPVVALVSVGEPRRLLLRPRGGGPSRRYVFGGGDLLVMGGTCQRTWEHTIPKVSRAGPRISLAFRHGV